MGIYLYHASPIGNRESIRKNGLRANQGRIGHGVYFVFEQRHAERIGKGRYVERGKGNYDIWTIEVDQSKCSSEYTVGEHPAWLGLDAFKEVCVPETDTRACNVHLRVKGTRWRLRACLCAESK